MPESESAAVRRDVDRVVAFSDGVFSIAITLLVLSIDVPDVPEGRLDQALEDLIPFVFTYFLSFLVVGLYWLAHHRMFRSLERVDRNLLWLNLLALSFVVLLPVPTELLGRYGETTVATVVYAGSLALAGGAAVLLYRYMNHAGLAPKQRPEVVTLGTWRGAIPPLVFAASIPIAFVDPAIGKFCWLAIWPANVALERVYGKDAYTD